MKPLILAVTLLIILHTVPQAGAQTPILGAIGSAEIVLTESYAQTIKGEKFLEGNRIKGASLKGVEGGFLIIAVPGLDTNGKGNSTLIIPVSGVLYIKGKEKLVNF